MNNLFTKLAGLGLVATVLLSSCEKDEDKVVVSPGTSSALTASSSSAVLTQADAAKTAMTYSWSPTSYGYQAAVTYTLQFDKKGGDFSAPVEVVAGNATSKALTGAELNNVLLQLKLTPGVASEISVRLKSSIGPAANMAYSAASALMVTPYSDFVVYPQIFVPGDYQGWAPDKAPYLASASSNQKYEGYINLPAATATFKFTPARNWDNDYGDDGSNTGKLAAKGKDITITGAGYYRFNVDIASMKYTYTKTAWAVIGSATPGGWNTETPMTYDATKGTWSVTLPLVAGDFKFRANNAYDIDMGDNEPDGKPDYKGKDIKGPGAGTYTIVLDLSKGEGNYSYSVNK
ncbi:SusE domain-containing protein [Hymenobacter sediminis]|uniref:SusE domain-containing protein n=1 Tax=Hymenobacter sediminis TaxID=2218621 RepID=UPI0013905674|nr:SusE domain-containing protein [Hymenobacter sediminis]